MARKHHVVNPDDHEFDQYCSVHGCLDDDIVTCHDDACERPHVYVLTDAEYDALVGRSPAHRARHQAAEDYHEYVAGLSHHDRLALRRDYLAALARGIQAVARDRE